jgi:hypothetical protein
MVFVLPAFSQNDTTENSYVVNDTLKEDIGLFIHDEILDISLRFDITEYRNKKPKDEYMNAIFTYHINEKDSINKEIRLKSRGEFRNEYCDFPPIRLNLKKTDVVKEELKDVEKMKLVTHCMAGSDEYVLKEYLIYKLYNVLTDASFRVRLLRIKYINTHKKSKPIISYGFLIEPLNLLADRINANPVDAVNLSQINIVPEMMDRVAIFNYMIGNTDLSVPNQHNCKILSDPLSARPDLGLIVPYDFDYSGLVDANYAVPYEKLDIQSVRERYYVGICRGEAEFINALKEFSGKKPEFYKVINEFPQLSSKAKKRMIDYLDEFYESFDQKNSIVADMMRTCKNL